MNAYELADFIDKYCEDNTSKEAAVLLRQQADRIAELEKQGKPVAWMYPNDNSLIVTHPLRMGTKVFTENDFKDWIPLYTTPQTKPLSDEEIFNLTAWKKNPYELYVEMEKEDMIAFARAIEERHGIK